jgi:hypothetical protein
MRRPLENIYLNNLVLPFTYKVVMGKLIKANKLMRCGWDSPQNYRISRKINIRGFI